MLEPHDLSRVFNLREHQTAEQIVLLTVILPGCVRGSMIRAPMSNNTEEQLPVGHR